MHGACPRPEFRAATVRSHERRFLSEVGDQHEAVAGRQGCAVPPQVPDVDSPLGEIECQLGGVLVYELSEPDASPGWERSTYAANSSANSSSLCSFTQSR